MQVSLHVTTVRITRVSCTPSTRCSKNPHQVSLRGTLVIEGIHLAPNMVVAFPSSPGARISSFSPAARLRRSGTSLVVTVPSHAHSGRIKVLLSKHRYTSSFGPIYVYAHSIGPPAAKLVDPAPANPSVFDGQGMWIWYMSASDKGSVAAIAEQAHAAGVTTLFIKSSDGSTNYWSQFSPQLVSELHAVGLKVCAWQYVYGSNPAGEAALGAEAVANGAECLVIDAEAEYEGHYAAAQTYLTDLRAKIGSAYPLGLASFPYVSYHPTFPYSVFLGPEGAQFNLPQMYWKDIGQSVDTVYANTYIANRVYARPIYPLGQTYGGVSSSDLLRFREEAVDYGATGSSFWDWQETPASGWATLAAPLVPLTTVTPNTAYPELASGSKGDPVLWMQEHLAERHPHPGNDRHLRQPDARRRRELPDQPRDLPQRGGRSSHLAGPAGAPAGGRELDRRRAEGLNAGGGWPPAGALAARRAGSGWRCRGHRRSTSSRTRSPCRNARARAGGS